MGPSQYQERLLARWSIPFHIGDGKRHYSFWWYTTILNHPRGWGGKPKGLTETAGLPKYHFLIFGPGFFYARSDKLVEKGTKLFPCADILTGYTDPIGCVLWR
jgi:hypothetical protein